ncbi:MAG: aldose 1-epimerase family protein [Pseudomonadales bacterium]
MIIDIQSDEVEVSVNSTGAELHSMRLTKSKEEFIWSGKPEVWSGRAPILFPIVGALKHTNARYGKKCIALEKHGFVRHSELECVQRGRNCAAFRFESNAATLAQYPWPFELNVRFEITGRRLLIEYKVRNLGNDTLPFNIGSHPAFHLPIRNGQHSDYSIVFNREEQLNLYEVNAAGLLSPNPRPYQLDTQGIPLSPNVFDNDALVFRNINSDTISLHHKSTGRRLSVETGGAPHLGIWAKPGSEFVCIEPWWGHADFDNAEQDFSNKTSIQSLKPGEQFNTFIAITLAEFVV